MQQKSKVSQNPEEKYNKNLKMHLENIMGVVFYNPYGLGTIYFLHRGSE